MPVMALICNFESRGGGGRGCGEAGERLGRGWGGAREGLERDWRGGGAGEEGFERDSIWQVLIKIKIISSISNHFKNDSFDAFEVNNFTDFNFYITFTSFNFYYIRFGTSVPFGSNRIMRAGTFIRHPAKIFYSERFYWQPTVKNFPKASSS